MSTIFSKIINGEIPSFNIFEDEKTIAFLDIHPKQLGHVLVVTKSEVDDIYDLQDEDYFVMFQTSKKIANAIKLATNCTRVCMMVVGLEIPHAHVHLIPINSLGDENQETKEFADDQMVKIQKQIIENLR